MKRNDCAFHVPHELTGVGTVCALLHNTCNGYGKRCLAYRKQTAEEKRQLEEALEKAKEKGETK